MDLLILSASFGMVALAAHMVGRAFKVFRLPSITGYLFAGAVAGSFVLDLIPSDSAPELRFVDEISLSVIAFVAGSELFLKEIRPRLRPILTITGGIVAVAFVLLALGLYALTAMLEFTRDFETGVRLATAILGAAVLLALSPPSTIAVIKDMRSRGRFTRTVLGVTVTMDIVIVVLFATMTSLASPLLTGDSLNVGFVGLLILDLIVATALGAGAALVLHGLMSARVGWIAKAIVLLAFGLAIYELADLITNWSKSTLPFEVHMEPLLIGLIGGFGVANFSPHRLEFEELLHKIGPPVYVAFFTVTGLSLKLDVLWAVLPAAAALFVVRGAGIGVGSWIGARWAGEPKRHRSLYSWAFITQAGIALGLAREVAVQFPTLGDTFATLVISVIVINEVLGPLFLKSGLRRSGESHEPGARDDSTDAAVVFGVESQSIALARGLQRMGWEVVVVDTDADQVERLAAADVDERWIEGVDEASLATLITDKTSAVVAMLDDDGENRAVLRYAADEGVPRLVVRPSDGAGATDLGGGETVVIDPGTAMVALLEQAVAAPQSASLLMRQDPSRQVNQVTITNPDVSGLSVRDLRLPPDVLLLQIDRGGIGLAVSGHTTLRIGDEVTVLSPTDSFEEVRVRVER